MSFLDKNIIECLSAKVTDLGRKRISEGNFNILYFKVGDSEYDYNFDMLDEFVTTPVEKDLDLKYPLLMDNATRYDYATVTADHSTVTVTEDIPSKGIISGATLTCSVECLDLNTINGQNSITVPSASGYTNCSSIVLSTQTAVGSTATIVGNSLSYYFNIVSISGNTINLDRPTPDFSSLTGGTGFVSCLDCSSGGIDTKWKMNIVWTEKPAGLDFTYESLSGYGSNAYASAKEYFGYTSVSGQTNNTSTTFTNSLQEVIINKPTNQKTIALIHYSGENFDTYEDWLADDEDALDYFEVHIPFLLYHRTASSTIGQKFTMSSTAGYIVSTKNTSIGEKYHYLIDEAENKVGKVFVNKRIIVIDDEEIVAALSMSSKRTWTLPAPRLNYVPVDLACSPDSGMTPLLSGTTKDVWVTYLFEDENDSSKNGMHCNYYLTLSGITGVSNISVKFGDEFPYMVTSGLNGFKATKLKLLIQLTNAGERPSPDNWTLVDVTNQIPGYVSGNIDPADIPGIQFIVTFDSYDSGTLYLLPDYLGSQPLENGGQAEGQFGDETIFPGSVKATRATNIHEMNFLVNLPASQFTVSQNPTKNNDNARVTEIGLLNKNKELLVIAKTSSPQERVGFQQFSVRIDF